MLRSGTRTNERTNERTENHTDRLDPVGPATSSVMLCRFTRWRRSNKNRSELPILLLPKRRRSQCNCPEMQGLKSSSSELYSSHSFPESPRVDPFADIISAESMSPERLVYPNQVVNKVDEEGMVYVGIPHKTTRLTTAAAISIVHETIELEDVRLYYSIFLSLVSDWQL
jgi:hypothetical protein